MRKQAGSDKANEKVVRDVIKKYGDVINLRETPYVLIEILQNFRGRLADDDGGLPGGTPPPPPPGPSSRTITNEMLMKEILNLSREVASLKQKLSAR